MEGLSECCAKGVGREDYVTSFLLPNQLGAGELLFMHLRSCLLKLTLSSQGAEARYRLSSCKGQSFNSVFAPGWWENPTTRLEADPKA